RPRVGSVLGIAPAFAVGAVEAVEDVEPLGPASPDFEAFFVQPQAAAEAGVGGQGEKLLAAETSPGQVEQAADGAGIVAFRGNRGIGETEGNVARIAFPGPAEYGRQ